MSLQTYLYCRMSYVRRIFFYLFPLLYATVDTFDSAVFYYVFALYVQIVKVIHG